jgi:hypothetical protein
MQVSATLIAAQQAAREAQAKFHATHIAAPQPAFAAALEKTESFSSLPLKQIAPQPAPAPQAPAAPNPAARLGTMVDIKI